MEDRRTMNISEEILQNEIARAKRLQEAHNEMVEDALAGLLAAGTEIHDIQILKWPHLHRTEIAVRGEVKYRFQR